MAFREAHKRTISLSYGEVENLPSSASACVSGAQVAPCPVCALLLLTRTISRYLYHHRAKTSCGKVGRCGARSHYESIDAYPQRLQTLIPLGKC